MKTAPASELGRAGDSVLLASSGHVSTSPDRRGQIVDVLGDPGHESYLVRWLDGRLSVLSPAAVRLAPEGPAALVHVIGSDQSSTNVDLVREWGEQGLDAVLVSAEEALHVLGPGDVAVGRLDVLPTLDGVEPGLLSLLWLERAGVRVLNCAAALITVHDKLRTARRLDAAGIPHPHTTCVRSGRSAPELQPPLVVKPRFGSWGRDVVLCRDAAELRAMPRSCQRAVRGFDVTARSCRSSYRRAAMTSA